MDERNLHDDYQRKSVRIPPPKPMRDVLSQLLAKRGYAQVQTAATATPPGAKRSAKSWRLTHGRATSAAASWKSSFAISVSAQELRLS